MMDHEICGCGLWRVSAGQWAGVLLDRLVGSSGLQGRLLAEAHECQVAM